MATLIGSKAVMKALENIAKKMGGGSVSVGFMSESTYPDGTPVAAVAFWNEYGHGGQFPAPPRPFFRNMIAKESPGWSLTMAKQAKLTDYNGEIVLGRMGELIKGQLQESINDLVAPALSKTTIMLRDIYGNQPHEIRRRDVLAAQELVEEGYTGSASTKPLNWTGHMLNSVTYEVKE